MGRKPELLAPAGDMMALRAALAGGADAVYLAGPRFGARAFAANFGPAELRTARRATRALGRKLYVAVNTVVFDREMGALDRELDQLEALSPDALIVQDLGVLARLRERGSALPCHLSTQAAWDGAGGGELLRALGVTRVVLPRETPLALAARLAAEGPFEVEIFVHGAHCYSVSGRCFWSAALGPRSGNRGTCAQPCRRNYESPDGARSLFSPRDLRLAEHVSSLVAARITSLKIEGRMKDAGYVRAAVEVYRRALDGKPPGDEGAEHGRESGTGFVEGAPRRWRTEESVGALGREVGRVTGPPDGTGRVPAVLEGELRSGDGVAWRVGSLRQGARVTWVGEAGQGPARIRFRGEVLPPVGARLFRTGLGSDADPSQGYDPSVEREEICLTFFGREGEPLGCKIQCELGTRSLFSPLPLQPARGDGIEGLLPERFAALGEGRVMEMDLSGLGRGLFLPGSALKALRREVRAFVEGADSPPATEEAEPPSSPVLQESERSVVLRVWRAEDLADLSHLRPSGGWILPWHADATGLDGPIGRFVGPAQGPEEAGTLASQVASLPEGTELVCASWEAFALREAAPHLRLRLDWPFNVANGRARDLLAGAGLDSTPSVECEGPLPGAVAVARLNPLVSVSRFPPDERDEGRALRNSHGDTFCLEALQPGLWGLFLLDRLPESLPQAPRVQLDVYLPREPQRRERSLDRLARLLG